MPTRYYLPSILLGTILLSTPTFGQSASERLDQLISSFAESTGDAAAGDHGFNMTAEAFERKTRHALHDAFAAAQLRLLHQQRDQTWDPEANGGEGDWVDQTRMTYSRNDQGLANERLFDAWDVDAQDWIPSFRQNWQHDEQGRIVETLDEGWEPDANAGEGAWEPQRRTSTTYNEQGNWLTSTTEFWDEDAGDFFIYSRRTLTYDTSGEVVLQEMTESALFGPLVPSFRYRYTYENGNATEILTENWSSTTQEWYDYRIETSVYDGNGSRTERAFQLWDDEAEGWVNRDRTLTLYTPDSVNPTDIETIDQDWDPEADGGSGAWVNADREIDTYQLDSMTATNVEQVWDQEANGGEGDWLNVERLTAEFSSSGGLVSFLYEDWNATMSAWESTERGSAEFDENGHVVVQLTEAWDGAGWVNLYRSLLSYQEFNVTAAEDDQPAQRFQLEANYPNPFRAATTIRYTLAAPEHVTLEVYDMLGRRVTTLVDSVRPKGVHEVTLDAGKLAGGLYVYRLSGEHVLASRTMLLVR
jgi:hypothetical protein